MILSLAIKSAGIGFGTFVGICIGLFSRRRRGNTEGLLRGSVLLTALAGGLIAWVLAMVVYFVIGASA